MLPGNMGNGGDPKHSPNHKFHISYGINRSFGYQGSMSVTYFFTEQPNVPDEARQNAIKFLQSNGYEKWLKEKGII